MKKHESKFTFGDLVGHKTNPTIKGIITKITFSQANVEYNISWNNGQTDWRTEIELETWKEQKCTGFKK